MNRDLEIWEMVQEKQEDAFSKLYYSYVDMLFSYGRNLGYESVDIEDAIHDLFVKIYLNRGKYFHVVNLKAYLYISLKNTLLNRVTKQTLVEFETEKHEVEGDGVEDEWIGREMDVERQEVLQRCMDVLTPRQREVIYFRYFKGLSFKEIADEMKINVQSAKNIAQSAVNRMKAHHLFLLFYLFS